MAEIAGGSKRGDVQSFPFRVACLSVRAGLRVQVLVDGYGLVFELCEEFRGGIALAVRPRTRTRLYYDEREDLERSLEDEGQVSEAGAVDYK